MFGAYGYGQFYFGQAPPEVADLAAFGLGAVQLENVNSGSLELVGASSGRTSATSSAGRTRLGSSSSKRASLSFGSGRARLTNVDSVS